MSGDVQPKKRRDKRKKKEDQIEETVAHQHAAPTPTVPIDDTNIHVHKEKSIGGGICAKCIFFIITIAIAIIIGLTITEHRGITDIDIPLSESRFASIFEGWIDTERNDDHDEGVGSDEVSFDHDDNDDEDSHEEEEEEEDEGVGSEEDESTEETEETEQEETQEEEEEDTIESEDQESEESPEQEESTEQDESAENASPENASPENASPENTSPESQEQKSEEQFEEDEEEELTQSQEESQEHPTLDDDDEPDQPESNEVDQEGEGADEQEEIEDPQPDEVTDATTSGGIKGLGDNAAESESDDEPQRRSGAQSYDLDNITNAYDYEIRENLDYAENHLPTNVPLALNLFIKILVSHPDSPRAMYGRARCLDHLAEKKRSNDILQESIKYFLKVLSVKNTPNALFITTAERCIDRLRFMGSYSRAIDVHNLLIERFPAEIKYRNDLAVTLLTINKIPQARKLLLETLKKWPDNGFALVHYGFILKTVDNNLPSAIEYLTRGINTKEPGVIDGRFYFHLGDALSRSGQNDLAMKVNEEGVSQKVFLSKYQRSLYNVDKLTGRPWWRTDQTPYTKLFQLLQNHWRDIRKEGLDVLNKKGYFKDEAENLRDVGDWKQFELYARGVKNKENCRKCPLTCQIIDSCPEARTCVRGQVKFSVMHPGTHVWPHCGPTNCRLRSHLGLKVPPRTYIRVAEEIRSWEEGKVLIFDDSFEHEVWHNGTEFRLVLIVDAWHPELTKSERSNLSPI